MTILQRCSGRGLVPAEVTSLADQEATGRSRLFLKPRSGVMLRRCVLAILLGGGLLATSDSSAQQGQAVGGSLSEAARQAARNFQPVAPQDAARAKGELAAAMSQLDAFLRT